MFIVAKTYTQKIDEAKDCQDVLIAMLAKKGIKGTVDAYGNVKFNLEKKNHITGEMVLREGRFHISDRVVREEYAHHSTYDNKKEWHRAKSYNKKDLLALKGTI